MLLSQQKKAALMKTKINPRTIERGIYILIIMAFCVYALKDSDTAEKLIRAVTEAFTIIINTQ